MTPSPSGWRCRVQSSGYWASRRHSAIRSCGRGWRCRCWTRRDAAIFRWLPAWRRPRVTKFTQAAYAEGGDAKQVQPRLGAGFHSQRDPQASGRDHADCDRAADQPGRRRSTKIAATFRKLKRIVMMGGSVYKGYKGGAPDPEWNILCDIPAAQKVFTSGVPLYVMPLDATILKLDPNNSLRRCSLSGRRLQSRLRMLYAWSGATDDSDSLRSDGGGICGQSGALSDDTSAPQRRRQGLHAAWTG